MPRAGSCDFAAEDRAEERWPLLVFYTADRVGCFAGQLGRPGDRGFDEADLVDQALVERLLGGEDLAGGDGVECRFVVFELRPAADDDRFETFEAVVDQRLQNLASPLASSAAWASPSS